MNTPSNLAGTLARKKNMRDSNLELFRIIVMLFIIAHHYVVNSEISQLMTDSEIDNRVIFFRLFGAWGKTGINCFVMITGYFMCTSQITLRKFLKLYLEYKFYQYAIWGIFYTFGIASISAKTFTWLLPFTKINTSFTNAFMAFFLFIPFLNILVHNMTRLQHFLLTALLLWIYTIMEMTLSVTYNYLSWFITLYMVASFTRLYGLPHNNSPRFWGWITLTLFVFACISIIVFTYMGQHNTYFLVSDSNHILALLLAISSFMFFKNLRIQYSTFINNVGATTFGVFLIHTSGHEMRQWLWYDIVDCGGHYEDTYFWVYSIFTVLAIFIICSSIDRLRIIFLEK